METPLLVHRARNSNVNVRTIRLRSVIHTSGLACTYFLLPPYPRVPSSSYLPNVFALRGFVSSLGLSPPPPPPRSSSSSRSSHKSLLFFVFSTCCLYNTHTCLFSLSSPLSLCLIFSFLSLLSSPLSLLLCMCIYMLFSIAFLFSVFGCCWSGGWGETFFVSRRALPSKCPLDRLQPRGDKK